MLSRTIELLFIPLDAEQVVGGNLHVEPNLPFVESYPMSIFEVVFLVMAVACKPVERSAALRIDEHLAAQIEPDRQLFTFILLWQIAGKDEIGGLPSASPPLAFLDRQPLEIERINQGQSLIARMPSRRKGQFTMDIASLQLMNKIADPVDGGNLPPLLRPSSHGTFLSNRFVFFHQEHRRFLFLVLPHHTRMQMAVLTERLGRIRGPACAIPGDREKGARKPVVRPAGC